MSALTTALTKYGADPSAAMDLLEDRERDKLDLLLKELQQIDLDLPARIDLGDARTLHRVNDVLATAARTFKELEALRRSILRVPEATVRSVNDLFRPLTAALKRLDGAGKELILRYNAADRELVARERAEQERLALEAAEAQAAAEARAAEAQTDSERSAALAEAQAREAQVEQALASAPREPVRGVQSNEGTTSVRDEWHFEVVDADLVPREYLVVDEKKLRAAVRGMGVRTIAGVHIFKRTIAATRLR